MGSISGANTVDNFYRFISRIKFLGRSTAPPRDTCNIISKARPITYLCDANGQAWMKTRRLPGQPTVKESSVRDAVRSNQFSNDVF